MPTPMATEVNLPELGESVTEGTVTRWLKQVGDEVAVDDPLLEVSTDKVDTEIPSPVAGTLLEIRANEDETVEVGAVLALVGSSDEAGGEGGSGGEADGQQDQQHDQQPDEDDAATTALDEERVEREQAHDQAERADTPDPGSSAPDSATDQAPSGEESKDEAPREQVAAAAAGA